MADWTAAVEGGALAAALRGSVWAYPLVNAVHIFGVALLVGSILPLDLRLLGFWPATSLATLWRVLTRVAAVGLGLAVASGALLFVARATDYVASALVVAKMTVVGAGIANALVLHAAVSRKTSPDRPEASLSSPHVRIAACLSMAAWISALFLGRLVGYF